MRNLTFPPNHIHCLTPLTLTDKEENKEEEPRVWLPTTILDLYTTTSTSPRYKPIEEEGVALASSAAEEEEEEEEEEPKQKGKY